MQTFDRLGDLRAGLATLRAAGPVALVPTMGALHAGHLALVRAAQARGARVVVSLFVNPRQFGPAEDLASYPRDPARDMGLLAAEGVAALWAPSEAAMYPPGYATEIAVGGLADRLCGPFRPGHFAGVATVVGKLFNQVEPDLALFGEKDWQQLVVIRRMAADLDLTRPAPAAILGVPTVREADGLAMSSRNAYLSAAERAAAAALPRAMAATGEAIGRGQPVAPALAELTRALITRGFASVDYATLADTETLADVATVGARPARLFVAARIGKARLIDNIAVSPG